MRSGRARRTLREKMSSSEPPDRLPRRRGRPAVLSATAIVAAAVDVIDRDGLDACSMRAVASALGASPMSIYRHVADKAALVEKIPDHLLTEVATGVTAARGAEASLRAVADGVAHALRTHPNAAPLFARPAIGPAMTAAARHCVGELVAEGWSTSVAGEILRAIVAQVIGDALTSHDSVDRGGRLSDVLGTGDAPAGMLGVDLLLAGVRDATSARTTSPTGG
jgi:AcrR family transcriptional regulator